MIMLNDNVKIVRVFTTQDYHGYYQDEECHIEVKYGWRRVKFVYVLYEDQTWEKFVVFNSDYWDCPQNQTLQLSSRLKNKTRGQAIELIEQLILSGKMDGKLLV